MLLMLLQGNQESLKYSSVQGGSIDLTYMNREPWPDRYVENRFPSDVNFTDFRRILECAPDERPLQDYLAEVPAMLRLLVPPCSSFWFFDRPSLGGDFIPDFLLCFRDSRGYNWSYVELESPTKNPLIKSGRPSAKLVEAQSQITDWRNWLRSNISYARDHLGLIGIDAEAQGVTVIGRRAAIDPKHALRYRALSNDKNLVMSYDRFLEPVQIREVTWDDE